MQSTPDLRLAERAVDELRRGHAVRLDGVFVRAAEAVGQGERLVLSGTRGKYLGISDDNNAITLAPAHEALVKTALYGSAVPPGTSVRKADALEQAALHLVKRAGFLPAALLGGPAEGEALSLTRAQAEAYFRAPAPPLTRLPEAKLPLSMAKDARIVPFRAGGATHLAILIGTPEKIKAPLVRLHSSCLTGDLLGSLRCDCGDQLHLALKFIAGEGAGVLLYLDQEGRGIGLANKLRAYGLQDRGIDTVDANHALGFSGDERDFSPAARILQALGIPTVRLLTNNPAKVEALMQAGIRITERVPLHAAPHAHNRDYLATKRKRLGHHE